MTGATIVRWESAGAVVLAVHGAFDGASAWALRNEMDESHGREFVVDLTHAVEACDFAACLLATWAKARRGEKRVRFLPGSPEHAPLLAAHGLEIVEEGDASVLLPHGLPAARRPAPSGAPA
jgi:anti-anti-sigma regulatory factor